MVRQIKPNVLFARALVNAPGNLTLRYHSAMTDATAGDKTSAIMTLKDMLEETVDFPDKEKAAKLLVQLEGNSIKLMKKILSLNINLAG